MRRIGGGRVGAFEILIANPAVRNLIREKKTYELLNVMQINISNGMQTLDDSLASLVRRGVASEQEALTKSSNPERLKKSLLLTSFISSK